MQAELRAVSIAIEAYYVDCSAYPAWGIGPNGVNSAFPPNDPAAQIPTFMIRSERRPNLMTLTTPFSYLSSYPADRFAPTRGASYGYWVGGQYGQGWILYSAGPDMKYDIVPWEDYDPFEPTRKSLINHAYDPTNGLESRGDVYKIKQ